MSYTSPKSPPSEDGLSGVIGDIGGLPFGIITFSFSGPLNKVFSFCSIFGERDSTFEGPFTWSLFKFWLSGTSIVRLCFMASFCFAWGVGPTPGGNGGAGIVGGGGRMGGCGVSMSMFSISLMAFWISWYSKDVIEDTFCLLFSFSYPGTAGNGLWSNGGTTGGVTGTAPFAGKGGGGGTDPFVREGGSGGGGGGIPGKFSAGGGGKASSIVRSSRLAESSGGGGRLSILASLDFLSSSSLSCFSCKNKSINKEWC